MGKEGGATHAILKEETLFNSFIYVKPLMLRNFCHRPDENRTKFFQNTFFNINCWFTLEFYHLL